MPKQFLCTALVNGRRLYLNTEFGWTPFRHEAALIRAPDVAPMFGWDVDKVVWIETTPEVEWECWIGEQVIGMREAFPDMPEADIQDTIGEMRDKAARRLGRAC